MLFIVITFNYGCTALISNAVIGSQTKIDMFYEEIQTTQVVSEARLMIDFFIEYG